MAVPAEPAVAASSRGSTGASSSGDSPLAAAAARLARTRFFSAFICGSRSLRSATSGVAMKIEEYAPAARPTKSESEMSFSMPAPKTPPPMKSSPATGSSATTVVLMERTRVLLIDRLAISLYVKRVCLVMSFWPSLRLSNTTTVSYRE